MKYIVTAWNPVTFASADFVEYTLSDALQEYNKCKAAGLKAILTQEPEYNRTTQPQGTTDAASPY